MSNEEEILDVVLRLAGVSVDLENSFLITKVPGKDSPQVIRCRIVTINFKQQAGALPVVMSLSAHLKARRK